MSQPKDFGFDEDVQMLKESFGRFLEEQQTIEALRPSIKGTEDPIHGADRPAFYDEKAWQQCIELGMHAVSIPEEQGGIGMGLVAAVAISEEIGRHAWASPLSNTLQSTFVLIHCESGAANALLAQMAEGHRVGLALNGEEGSLAPDGTDVTAGEDGRLTGTSWYVQDAMKTETLIVSARSESGTDLYAVSLSQPEVVIHRDRIVDLTRDQAHVELSSATAVRLTENGSGASCLLASAPALATLVAADMAGAGEWQLQTTAEYAKVRQQFDRPIGFFQAVKHPIVDMMIFVDEARSLVYNAAAAYDFDRDDAPRCAHLAKSSASDMGAFSAQNSTQLHGGIGFTWEADVQIYHKRQMHSQFLFGDGTWHREQLATLL